MYVRLSQNKLECAHGDEGRRDNTDQLILSLRENVSNLKERY